LGEGGAVVAVLHLEGSIVMDDSGGFAGRSRPMIRARKVLPMLQELREDERVGAVVLHVNSPGGSALASDLLWREVGLLAKAKPVIASFADVAASGGYYLSAPVAEIFARSATLTGSIGVVGGKLVIGEGLRKVGVFSQTVTAASNATVFSPNRVFSDEQRVRFRQSLQRFYDGFVERVAEGRNVAFADVEPHCRGRVWTGRQAKERGLVDRRGDLQDAVERARVLAGLDALNFVRWDLPGHKVSMVERAVAGRLGAVGASLLGMVGMGPVAEVFAAHPGEPLAVLPFEVDWMG
jgi:protease-4